MKKLLYLAVGLILLFNSLTVDAQAFNNHPYTPAPASTNSKSIDNLVGHCDNRIKVIFSDIDGTLIPLDKTIPNVKVPDSVRQATQKLKSANIPLVLVTGRSVQATKRITNEITNENIYIIALQGAEIISPDGKSLYQSNITNKDVKSMLKEVENFNKFLHKTESSKKSTFQDAKAFFFIEGQPYSKENTKFPYCSENIKIFKSFNELKPNFCSSKIVLYEPDTEKMKLIQAHLKKSFPNLNIDMATDCTLDITSKSVTKGTGVKHLADILGVDLKNSAVFGDSENDLTMFKQVKSNGGLVIAVDNAMDTLKDNADFVTSSVYEDGFAKAIDKILKNNALLKKIDKN